MRIGVAGSTGPEGEGRTDRALREVTAVAWDVDGAATATVRECTAAGNPFASEGA
jgi:hypothetical protein